MPKRRPAADDPRLRRARRWAVVLAGTAVLVSLPWVIGSLPAGHSSVTAKGLFYSVRDSARIGWRGDAQATGSLAVPDLAPLGQVSDLLSGTTTLRVWWRSSTDYRVDDIDPTGERDVYQDGTGTWTWDYETGTAVRSSHGTQPLVVRLPAAADLVAPSLARRLLSEAHPSELTRLPVRRIAGRPVPGLRLRPDDPDGTIDHVDVWALANSGLALRVQVYARGQQRAVLSSSLLDLHIGTPPRAVTTFRPPTGARVSIDDFPDEVSTIDRTSSVRAPGSLAGQQRRYAGSDPGGGAVGVYGSGLARFVAVPLRPRQSHTLAAELAGTLGTDGAGGADSRELDQLTLTIGPVNLLLTAADRFGGRWLLLGAVTAATLQRAVDDGVLPPVPGRFR